MKHLGCVRTPLWQPSTRTTMLNYVVKIINSVFDTKKTP